MSGYSLLAGGAIDCTGAAGAPCLAFDTTYEIKFADIDKDLQFDTPLENRCSAAGSVKKVKFLAATEAYLVDGEGLTASGCGNVDINVYFPCLTVTKACDRECTPWGEDITFTVIVSNTGDSALTDIVVTDTPEGGAPYVLGTIALLAAGQTVTLTGTVDRSGDDGCGPYTDTVTATGIDIAGRTVNSGDDCVNPANGSIITKTPATATCYVSTDPKITLAKYCYQYVAEGEPDKQDKTLVPGESYVVEFRVENTGNVPLENVVITDLPAGTTYTYTDNGGRLAPGGVWTVVSAPIPVTADDCPSVTDSATVSGDNICPNSRNPACDGAASASASAGPVTCTIEVRCVPVIEINKLVACDLGATCGTFAKTATGVRNGDCPAFCWQVTIRNTGTVPVDSLVVSDSVVPGFETADWNLPIPVNGTRTITISDIEYCDPETVNTVTATPYLGDTATGVAGVPVTSSATALVIPMSLTCEVALFYANDQDNGQGGANHVTVPAGSVGTSVEVSLTINNTGDAAINVTSVNGLPPLVDCTTGDEITPEQLATILGLPFTLGVNESKTTDLGCWLVTCDGADGGSFGVSVTAEADDNDGALCVRNDAGDIITTETENPCPASVDCQTPTECRTTGGGTLHAGDVNENCVTVTTVLFPTSQNGLTLDHISHGGQMGAPYANQDCANLLADPCIRGQWQHTRHYKGKGNPRHIIESDFHSNTPKGVFDTLKCECLGCCPNDEGNTKKGPNGNFTGWNQKFQVCNYGDFRVCGPVPRPAPANALIWSGVGTGKFITDTVTTGAANKAAEWMIIRAYVEDRSEPGGHHPKGSVDPSDVYVFQAWRTGVLVAKKADPNDPTILAALMPGQAPGGTVTVQQFRAALSADSCAFLTAVSKEGTCPPGTLPPTTVAGIGAAVYDQGPLRNGNRQIHPVTGATCTAEGGIPVNFDYPVRTTPYCDED